MQEVLPSRSLSGAWSLEELKNSAEWFLDGDCFSENTDRNGTGNVSYQTVSHQ